MIGPPALTCLEAVINTADYPQWNNFCPKAIIGDSPPLSTAQMDESIPAELKETATLGRNGCLRPGVKFQFEVKMKRDGPTTLASLEVSKLEKMERDGKKGYRVAWSFRGMPSLLMRTERVQGFVEAEEGRSTEYYCWETFGGLMAYTMPNSLRRSLEDGLGRWMYTLKARVEKGKH